ncbi:hypothetical protein MJ_0357 [Methanocaldococcus jannaschii DSM 2661]|uniref:Uncharacterized protein MJ0357 n=1 Tax=Methanocaldococcus jannaschii (strain ATCC 43067 / DSM 2661 / JAL-1 / JCM 10045 / NBRC 100440) TaxID=243232 RepID=Y357_METJA|nr:protein-export chaperone SecB [Methanocaldococcus jannaschii]Q57803.1 RecName: Full=Uncharacterized protein MJ0357 [Methanocaldococcus jannaschii DSM 2661]AAB98349.1 hypothetical protein MJ_0357 [Methanocaldococcus jannaschii DSM 2661]
MEAPPKCALKFSNYIVKHIEFILNEVPEKDEKIRLNVNIDTEIRYNKNEPNKFITIIKITAGEKKDFAKSPVYLSVEVWGFFEVIEEAIDKVRQFAEINSVAILFPYVRALISTITANANIPPVILPPINVAGMMANIEEVKEENTEKQETEAYE